MEDAWSDTDHINLESTKQMMDTRTRLIGYGHFMFRWRSYTPLALLPLAFVMGDATPLPTEPPELTWAYKGLCLAIAILGAVVRMLTVGTTPPGTSGRNTKAQVASALNTGGIYSVVRNPLYLGNGLIFLGLTLWVQNWLLIVFYLMAFAMAYTLIILAEEEFLREKHGQPFEEFVTRVPAFFPRLSLWQRGDRRLSLRRVLRREHDTWLSMLLYLAFMDYALNVHLLPSGQSFDERWWWAIGGLAAVNLVLKIIARTTPLLKV